MSDAPEGSESAIKAWGYDVSVRGMLAFVSVASLCALTWRYPETFGKAFESVAIAIVGFYFGQNSKK